MRPPPSERTGNMLIRKAEEIPWRLRWVCGRSFENFHKPSWANAAFHKNPLPCKRERKRALGSPVTSGMRQSQRKPNEEPQLRDKRMDRTNLEQWCFSDCQPHGNPPVYIWTRVPTVKKSPTEETATRNQSRRRENEQLHNSRGGRMGKRWTPGLRSIWTNTTINEGLRSSAATTRICRGSSSMADQRERAVID